MQTQGRDISYYLLLCSRRGATAASAERCCGPKSSFQIFEDYLMVSVAAISTLQLAESIRPRFTAFSTRKAVQRAIPTATGGSGLIAPCL